MMQLSTLRAVIQAFNTASDDQSRPHLCGVCLTAIGKNVRIRSTDAHCLSDVQVQDEEAATLIGDGIYFAQRDTFDALKLVARESKSIQVIKFEKPDGNHALALGNWDTIVRLKKIEAKDFADTDRIFPRDSLPYQIALDVDRLMDIAKAIGDPGKKKIVEINFKDTVSPLLVYNSEGKDPEVFGLLMPCRLAPGEKVVRK